MKLIHRGQVPYGGEFVINRPDLGIVAKGTVFDMLEVNARKYRKANAIPIGLGFDEELEQVVCEKYPDACEAHSDILPLKRRLGLDDVVRGTKVLLAFKLAGSPFVPREEAMRRGAICEKCPLCRKHPLRCGGVCAELKQVVDAIISGTYSTPYDTDPRACSICMCYYSSHIRIPNEILQKGLTEQMKAEFVAAKEAYGCWKCPDAERV